jgi:hypothetical protein
VAGTSSSRHRQSTPLAGAPPQAGAPPPVGAPTTDWGGERRLGVLARGLQKG